MADMVNTAYDELLSAYGLPHRMRNKRTFELNKHLQSYTAGDSVMGTKRQRGFYDTMLTDESGWLAFACGATILEYPKHLAASVAQRYLERHMRPQWLASFDRIDKLPFAQFRLLVIDALFFDSSAFRRDRVYEVINHFGNVPNLSICVIGQYTDPVAMSQHLGMKPDFGLAFK